MSLGATGEQPQSVAVEARVIRADGTVEDLGTIAYRHRSRLRTLLGQRRVRGGGILRTLLGRGPRVNGG